MFVDAEGNRHRLYNVGERVFFVYRCWESDESADADLWHRTRQPVTILGRLADVDEYDVGPMWAIRFDDSHTGHAWSDEISPGVYHV